MIQSERNGFDARDYDGSYLSQYHYDIHFRMQKFEREKMKHSRDEALFKRQIEALDSIAIFIAEPMNIAACAFYSQSEVTLSRHVDLDQLNQIT